METTPLTEVLCARCARISKSCCKGREIYITPGDVVRIALFCNRSDFMEWRVPADPDYGEQSDDPLWDNHVFRSDRSRRILKRSPLNDCTFLGPSGCLLPEGIRPLVCRLHPYTYTAAGIDPEPSQDCPRDLLPIGMSVFESLHMTTEQAIQWHRMLYEEILTENDNDYRTDL